MFDDSLSYYEVLTKLTKMVNVLLENTDTAEHNIEVIAETYIKLQDYVNHYFDSLDVSAEVDNRLDEMVEDGTLDAIIQPIVEHYTSEVIDDVVHAQLSAVVSEQIGGAVAEQIDAAIAPQITPKVNAYLDTNLPPLVEEQVPVAVGEQIDPAVSTLLPAVVNEQLPTAVNTEMTTALPPVVQSQLPGVVANQIPGVVSSQMPTILSPIATMQIQTLVPNWLSTHISNPSSPPLDNTLGLKNCAAESWYVGRRFFDIQGSPTTMEEDKKVVYQTGEVTDAEHWLTFTATVSDKFPVSVGYPHFDLEQDPIVDWTYAYYDADGDYIANSGNTWEGFINWGTVTDPVPAGAATIKFSIQSDAADFISGDLAVLVFGNGAQIIDAINAAVEDVDLSSIIDDTLTESGKAADAKVTGDKINALKNAVDEFYDSETVDFSTAVKQRWNIREGGDWYLVTSNSKLRTAVIPIPGGVKAAHVTAETTNGSIIAFLASFEPEGGATPDYATGSDRTVLDAGTSVTYTVPDDAVFFYCVLTDSSNNNKTPTVVFDSVKTGDDVLAMAKNLDGFYFDWFYGHYINSNGELAIRAAYAVTRPIPIKGGATVTNTSPDKDSNNRDFAFMLSMFTGNTLYARQLLAHGDRLTIPDGVDMMRITFGYPTNVTNPPDMSPAIMDAYFSVEITGYMQPFGLFTDGTHPYYAAFGASTTEGLVISGTGRSISRYNYPDYIGRVLNLRDYNFGVTGTGFMCRSSGDDNIMDQIYSHGDVLAKCGLVTIQFGYGNDLYVGPEGNQVLFPIGEFDDYYPYDAEGYHPTGQAGCVTMVEAGATLMGCLNWCIKWINTNYPYAQLVVIFGSPSANSKREIAMTEQTGSTGVAPYKLTFTDPYTDADDPTTPEYGIKCIGEEIAKLKKAINLPIIDNFNDGGAFSWYSTYAKNPSDNTEYALFSTGDGGAWNSHPSDEGYINYGRYIAGVVASQFRH